MKRCRRCHGERLDVVRESVFRRGVHNYAIWWYECRQCQDVSFSYRVRRDMEMTGLQWWLSDPEESSSPIPNQASLALTEGR